MTVSVVTRAADEASRFVASYRSSKCCRRDATAGRVCMTAMIADCVQAAASGGGWRRRHELADSELHSTARY